MVPRCHLQLNSKDCDREEYAILFAKESAGPRLEARLRKIAEGCPGVARKNATVSRIGPVHAR